MMTDETKPKKKTYEAAPTPSVELEARYQTVLAVVSGMMSVSEGARRLELSRNHFQTLMHRGLRALLEEIAPKPAGRPPKPMREAELEEENEQLQRENERLRQRVEATDRLLGVAGDLLRGRSGRSRERRSKRASTTKGKATPDEDARARLRAAKRLLARGMPWTLAALGSGTSPRTLSRWRARAWARQRLVLRRGPGPNEAPTRTQRRKVVVLVRASRGLMGAAALARSVDGVSRRQCAAIKRRELRRKERARVARCQRVEVTTPGVIRGFDEMHASTRDGRPMVLVAADGAVPHRTTIKLVARGTSAEVARALDEDFTRHGAPLVGRLDRAKSHQTAEVDEVLRKHEVLPLHGPPRYPQYYAQLERMNREHRAYLDAGGEKSSRELARDLGDMQETMNAKWPRASLGWCTTEDIWRARPVLNVNRAALRTEVDQRREALLRGATTRTQRERAERRAIEDALIARGLLRIQSGERC